MREGERKGWTDPPRRRFADVRLRRRDEGSGPAAGYTTCHRSPCLCFQRCFPKIVGHEREAGAIFSHPPKHTESIAHTEQTGQNPRKL